MATKDRAQEWGPVSASEYREMARTKKPRSSHPDEPPPTPPILPAQYEIRLSTGEKLHGTVSYVDHEKEELFLLDKAHVGMFGKSGDGRRIAFADCVGIYTMTSPGVYGSTNQIDEWRRFYRVSKL